MKKQASPNRIRELRKAKRLTLEELAGLTELSVSNLSRLENGKRNLTFPAMALIAKALGVAPSELIDVSRAWVEVEVTGAVTHDHEIISLINSEDPRYKITADVPAALGDVQAAVVRGNMLYPRYGDGDIITIAWHDDDIRQLIGQECVVLLTTGKKYVKTITPGSSPKRYHLTSFNAPPLLDVEIARAAPIPFVLRNVRVHIIN